MGPMFHRCEDCGGERLFEQQHEAPGSCPDSADGQCPEWSCTDCGGALFGSAQAGAPGSAHVPDVAGRVA